MKLLESVKAQSVEGFEFETIVIDDGSKDHTVELLEANPHLYTRLVKQPENGGKGAAVIAGLKVATGEFILFQDADLEYSPSEYKDLLYPVREFGADLVMGSRFVAPRFTRIFYFFHKAGNGLITLIFNLLFNTTFTDIYSCYLLYKREYVRPEELISVGWEQHAEILARARAKAKSMYEVPISYHGRSYEEGKKIKAHHALSVIGMIFRRRFFK